MAVSPDFNGAFADQTVLISGHTGFKGAWLSTWLVELGARVVGLSVDIPTKPSLFEAASLQAHVEDHRVDVRDREAVDAVVQAAQPDFVFHLAAQSLVRRSHEMPVQTIMTNAVGTAHVLEALRCLDKPCCAVLVTSDKCYENMEWTWGYRETDPLGGKDPYSASKAAAELIISAYVRSFFSHGTPNTRIGIARAGNVMGGGDWATDRLIPDCVRAWTSNVAVRVRSSAAVRPWQHVLEPLSGYLHLADQLRRRPELHGEPFNFGPASHEEHSVGELVSAISSRWPRLRWVEEKSADTKRAETTRLKLCCDKALHVLRWQPTLSFDETVELTTDWYAGHYAEEGPAAYELTRRQIGRYGEMASARRRIWRR